MLIFSSVLTFGKYKGKTLRHVVDNEDDVSYLLWLHSNTKHKIHPNTLAELYKYDEARIEGYMEGFDVGGFFGAPPDLDFMI